MYRYLLNVPYFPLVLIGLTDPPKWQQGGGAPTALFKMHESVMNEMCIPLCIRYLLVVLLCI